MLDTKNLTQHDADVVSYIAGSVLKKLFRKYKNGGEKRGMLFLLTCEKESPNCANISLTEAKDRGGLLYITNETYEVFQGMESIFRKELMASWEQLFSRHI